jgi:3-oxoacyl-[acyl-carrier protein] reductase
VELKDAVAIVTGSSSGVGAGTTRFCAHSNLEGLSKDDFLDIYSVNTIGVYQMTRAAAPHLKQRPAAHVVNTASIAGITGITGIGSSIAYAASKSAVLTLTMSLARVLGPQIRVNAACPGFIQGEWLKQGMGAEVYEARKTSIEKSAPLKATCTPEDVAAAIASFITGSDLVTGESLIVDGGAHLAMAPLRR